MIQLLKCTICNGTGMIEEGEKGPPIISWAETCSECGGSGTVATEPPEQPPMA